MAFTIRGILGLDGSGFFQTLQRGEAAATRFAGQVRNSIGARLAGMFSLGAMAIAIRRTTEYAGKLIDMSERTKVAVEDLQRLNKAAKDNGTSLETLTAFWDRLNRSRNNALKNPKGTESSAFSTLGVGASDLANKSALDLTRQIALKLQTSTNTEALIAPLQAVGGRGVGQLVALFRAGLDQMYQDLQVMTTADAEILDELDDSWSTLWETLAVYLAPGLVKIIGIFRNGFFNLKLLIEVAAQFVNGLVDGFNAFWEQIKSGNVKQAFNAFASELEKNIRAIPDVWNETIDQEAILRGEQENATIRRRKQRESPKELQFESFNAEKTSRPTFPTGDSLVKVGNFLGTSRDTVSRVAERHLQVAQESRDLLKDIKEELKNDSDFAVSDF